MLWRRLYGFVSNRSRQIRVDQTYSRHHGDVFVHCRRGRDRKDLSARSLLRRLGSNCSDVRVCQSFTRSVLSIFAWLSSTISFNLISWNIRYYLLFLFSFLRYSSRKNGSHSGINSLIDVDIYTRTRTAWKRPRLYSHSFLRARGSWLNSFRALSNSTSDFSFDYMSMLIRVNSARLLAIAKKSGLN